jgi:hypothetical protein
MSDSSAYKNLMQRLGSALLHSNEIQPWMALGRDRKARILDVLQSVIEEMLQRDLYLQQQIAWIGKCTGDPILRQTLLLVEIERSV